MQHNDCTQLHSIRTMIHFVADTKVKGTSPLKMCFIILPHTRKHGHSTGPKQKSSGAPKKNAADNQIHQYHQPRCLITIIYGTLSHKSLGCIFHHTHTRTQKHTYYCTHTCIFTHPPTPIPTKPQDAGLCTHTHTHYSHVLLVMGW